MSGFHITTRPAAKKDEGILMRLFSDMLTELLPYGHDIKPSGRNLHLFWRAVFLPAIKAGRHGIALAFLDGVVIGAVYMAPEESAFDAPEHRVIDWGCYVRPENRRKGVASRLRKEALDGLRRHGFKSVITHIRSSNIGGVESYRKIGAEFAGYQMEIKL
jgi:GNAT superfamily N-acetyltransferase